VRIGILGGTFDPIHYGHLIVANECRDAFQIDNVIFIPAKLPPHKINRKITDFHHRYKMTKVAVEHYPFFSVSDIELNRSGPSYTIDTLEQMQSRSDLFLIMGIDSFNEVATWHRCDDLLKLSRIIVVTRPGTADPDWNQVPKSFQELSQEKILHLELHGKKDIVDIRGEWRICFLPIPGLKISASEIRQRIQDDLTTRFLIPESIRLYIRENKLYRDESSGPGDL